jgi:hypothetical protein
MPFLLAMGLVQVATSVYWNKKTIDGGELEPQAMGTDARNVGVLGGLAVATVGAIFGAPLLLAGGLAVAGSSYVNKDATARVKTGLEGWIKSQADAAIAQRSGTAPALPGPAAPPPPPAAPPASGPMGRAAQQAGNAFLDAILPQGAAAPPPAPAG